MYIDKALLACCAKEGLSVKNPAIAHIYADADAGCVVAMDGHCLVAVPMTLTEGEVGGYVPREAILHAAQQRGAEKGALFHTEHTTTVAGVVFPNPFAGSTPPPFPDWRRCVPPLPTKPYVMQFDLDLLTTVARVLGTKKIWLQRDSASDVIHVSVPGAVQRDTDMTAIIMSLRG